MPSREGSSAGCLTAHLDDLVHQRVRLGILAVLHDAHGISFTQLRDTLGVTNGNLSRHLQVLEHAGYVRIDKDFIDRRPHTCVTSSTAGRDALRAEIRVLRTLVDGFASDNP